MPRVVDCATTIATVARHVAILRGCGMAHARDCVPDLVLRFVALDPYIECSAITGNWNGLDVQVVPRTQRVVAVDVNQRAECSTPSLRLIHIDNDFECE